MTFKLSLNWLDRNPPPSKDELEATLAAVRIIVDQTNVTEYVQLTDASTRRGHDPVTEKVHVPAYYLGEWIAENWWSLLYEPRKTEDLDAPTPAFDARHSVAAAQHGFALPDVRLEPVGHDIEICSRPRKVFLAGVHFRNAGKTRISRAATSAVLATFVQACSDRLTACDLHETPLQHAWQAIKGTSDDEATFCRLVGALGLNPYTVDPDFSNVVSDLYNTLGEQALLDVCMASTENDFSANGKAARLVSQKLDGAHGVTLAPLRNLRIASTDAGVPAWVRGRTAAINARKMLAISHSDARGADKLFQAIDLGVHGESSELDNDAFFISGGVDRQQDTASIALLPKQLEARRFAAGRAVFLALDSGPYARRILTDAVTRDQQASRAFSAELLAPVNHLKERATGRVLSRDKVALIANERRASFEAVRWQAVNSGLSVPG